MPQLRSNGLATGLHPISEDHPALRAYRARLLARPSIVRAVDVAGALFAGHTLGMTRWIGVVLVLAGCDAGYAQPCCVGEDGRAVLQGMGRVGQCTCASGAVCEYGMFTSCNDDSTRCVVSFSSPGNVTCAGGTAMTDVPCCIERDAEGIGSRSMCECPVFGECEGGLHGEWIEAIDETHCRLATPPWIDAGAPDAGG